MTIFEILERVEDPRRDINRKHHFLDVIFLTMSAVISGAEGWADIHLFGKTHLNWLRKYRPFAQGIPVDDTLSRIIHRIDPVQLNDVFINFINEIRKVEGKELIAIDGKTLRHAFEDSTQNALHSITVWSKSRGLILSQHK